LEIWGFNSLVYVPDVIACIACRRLCIRSLRSISADHITHNSLLIGYYMSRILSTPCVWRYVYVETDAMWCDTAEFRHIMMKKLKWWTYDVAKSHQ